MSVGVGGWVWVRVAGSGWVWVGALFSITHCVNDWYYFLWKFDQKTYTIYAHFKGKGFRILKRVL